MYPPGGGLGEPSGESLRGIPQLYLEQPFWPYDLAVDRPGDRVDLTTVYRLAPTYSSEEGEDDHVWGETAPR